MLSWIIDQTGAPGLWICSPFTLAVLALSAWVVLRSARDRNLVANGLIWSAAMFGVRPALAVLGSAGAAAR